MTGWLVDTLLATSGLALLVLLVREPVRKRFGSRVTYALWLIPASRLFMPTLTHTVVRTMPSATPMQPLSDPLVRESLWMARVAPVEPSLVDRIGGWPTIVIAIWLAVAAVLFLSRMAAFHRDRRAILDSCSDVARSGSVRIVRSAEIASPVALGILKPMIALPSDFERLYGIRERRLVIEHELAHHRSGDLVANLFAFVLLCLQWFNPLAWLAHRAFRFDQEAACDARVLDKATALDRADYGRAIAKAASGRALLFASALDRPTSLQRRLKSMLVSSTQRRRVAGRLLVVSAIAVALPLTASHAIQYVDVPAPAVPAIPAVPAVATAAVQATPVYPVAAPVPAAPPTQYRRASHADRNVSFNDGLITIDGKTKRWEELTPAEKAQVRSAVDQARAALAKVHIDQAKIMRDVAAVQQVKLAEIQRDLAKAQAGGLDGAIRGIDASGPYLRWSGQDPEQVKAAVREAMRSVQAIDPQVIQRALSAVDQRKIAESVAAAQKSMEAAKAEMDRLNTRMHEDRNN